MIVAKVVGTVVATVKHVAFEGRTVLLCQPIDEQGQEVGKAIIAVDNSQAGMDDTVLIMREGGGVRQMLGTIDGKLPIRSVIVGIVDEVST